MVTIDIIYFVIIQAYNGSNGMDIVYNRSCYLVVVETFLLKFLSIKTSLSDLVGSHVILLQLMCAPS